MFWSKAEKCVESDATAVVPSPHSAACRAAKVALHEECGQVSPAVQEVLDLLGHFPRGPFTGVTGGRVVRRAAFCEVRTMSPASNERDRAGQTGKSPMASS